MISQKKISLMRLITVFCIIVIGIFALSYNYLGDRRFVLYKLLEELKADMPKEDVISKVKEISAPFINRHYSKEGIVLWTKTGLMDTCYLRIQFSDDKLIGARIYGEDGPHDLYKDAPPDIILLKNASTNNTKNYK